MGTINLFKSNDSACNVNRSFNFDLDYKHSDQLHDYVSNCYTLINNYLIIYKNIYLFIQNKFFLYNFLKRFKNILIKKISSDIKYFI